MLKRTFLILISFLFVISSLYAQRGGRAQEYIEVRLGSALPRNSDWGRVLDRIAGEWARVTNNAVRMRVIHDGMEGNDAKMLSSLNADNIQAALFASTGLVEICPPAMTLSIPFLIKDEDEFDLVLEEVLPVLKDHVHSNYVVVAWSKGGWVYFFSREPVLTPDDLKRQRLSTSPDLRDVNIAFRRMDYNLNESSMVDLGTRLASGAVDATYIMPEAIAPFGLHRYLGNMLDMPIAPFIGAIVVNRVTWNKISPEHQQTLINTTQRIADEFASSMSRTTSNAIRAMQSAGLKVNKPSAAQEELWRADMDRVTPSLLGTTFNRELYQRIIGILEKSR